MGLSEYGVAFNVTHCVACASRRYVIGVSIDLNSSYIISTCREFALPTIPNNSIKMS